MAAEEHPKDALQELLDGRLQGEARARIEEHLASCETCRRELEALRLTKHTVRRAFAAEPAPPALEQRVLQALDREDARARELSGPRRRRLILWLGLAAAVLAAATSYLLRKPRDL